MTGFRWRRPAAVAGLVVSLIAPMALSASCSGPRSGASATSEVSGCAAVLPLASEVVHDEGTLTLVRRINKNQADALSRALGASPPIQRPHPGPLTKHHPVHPGGWPKACLVVYRGNYPPGTIAKASPPAVSGHYTLVVLRLRHPSVDRVLVTDRTPTELHL